MLRLLLSRNTLFFLLVVISFSVLHLPSVQAQTVLFSETFDSDENYTIGRGTECNSYPDKFFTRTDGTGLTNYSLSGQDGSNYFAAQNIDDFSFCNYLNGTNFLTFENIDVSGANSIDISILAAEDDNELGNVENWNSNTIMRVEYKDTNTTTYIRLFCFASNGSNISDSPGGYDDDCDGISDGAVLNSTFQSFSKNVTLNGINIIDIRIVFIRFDNPEEDIAIDLLQIIDPTITATCFATPDEGGTVYNTVQEAVDAAPDGGTVKIAGTCTGIPSGASAVVTINKNLTILGGYPADTFDWVTLPLPSELTTIDAESGGRVVLVETASPPVTVDFYNVTLQNGLAKQGGGIYNNGNIVYLINSFVTNNRAIEVGGGIATIGTLVLNNTDVNDNLVTSATSNVFGGGIAVTGDLTVTNASSISGNGADATGANSVAGGGGIYAVQSNITITSATFDENIADATSVAFGGAIASAGTQSLITDTVFTQNFARHLGGAILNYAINVPGTIADMVVQGGMIGTETLPNVAQYGGGIYNQYYLGIPGFPATYQTSLKLEAFGMNDAVITNNRASGGGGGIFNNGGVVTATDTIISNNEVTTGGGYGGGVFNTLGGDFVGTRVLLEGNNASYGGAIHTSGNRDDTMRAASINSIGSNDSVPLYNLPVPQWYTQNLSATSTSTIGILGDTVRRASTILNESAVINNGSSTSVGGAGLYINSAGDGTDARRGLKLTNVTISGHEIPSSGTNGAAGLEIAAHPDGSFANVELNYVTITNNTADTANGGVGGLRSTNSSNTVVLNNSILAFNTGDTSTGANDCFSTATEVVSFGTYTSSASGTECASVMIPDANLVLDLLTVENVHPLTAGIAVDGALGTCPPPATDQRGINRPINGNNLVDDSNECDAGAYEASVDTYNVSNTILNIPSNPQPNSNLIAPIGQTTETTPLFQWAEAENAVTYTIRLDGVQTGNPNTDSTIIAKTTFVDETFIASDICSRGICSVNFDLMLYAGVYQWWVKPDDTQGKGQWSPPATFRLVNLSPRPVQLAPQNTQTSVTPIFTWEADNSVQWYQLWVADSNGTLFSQWYKMRDICTGTLCIVQPPLQLADNVTYRWWVQSERRGAYSTWAGPASFTVDATQAVTTADNTVLPAPASQRGN